jgi:hypothetical protein
MDVSIIIILYEISLTRYFHQPPLYPQKCCQGYWCVHLVMGEDDQDNPTYNHSLCDHQAINQALLLVRLKVHLSLNQESVHQTFAGILQVLMASTRKVNIYIIFCMCLTFMKYCWAWSPKKDQAFLRSEFHEVKPSSLMQDFGGD